MDDGKWCKRADWINEQIFPENIIKTENHVAEKEFLLLMMKNLKNFWKTNFWKGIGFYGFGSCFSRNFCNF